MKGIGAGRIRAGGLAVCLLTPGTPAVAAGAATSPVISYSYDADGRLLTVTNAAGQTSAYSYDAAGNITGVSQPTAGIRKPASPARSTGPAPELGPLPISARAGSVLILPGRHFSPDRSLDKVSIGRLIAPVLRASASSLAVRVPPGSGGTVAVLTPAGMTRNGRVRITGSPAGPATAVARAPGSAPTAPPGVTALSGRVETAAGRPLAGVRVRITGRWGPDTASVTTGRSGWFLLTHLAAGKHQLLIGATSVGGTDYGTYAEPLQLPGGRTTVLPWTTYLTPIDTTHAVTVPSPTTKAVVVTSPELPGVQVRIPKGTVIRDRAGHLVRKLSLTALPLKRTPFPLAPGMPDFFTLQPGDATFSGPGVRVIYPNVTHLPPGATVSYVALNPDWGTASWYRYGTGTVAADGARIVPSSRTVFHQIIPFGYSPLPAPSPAPPPGGQTGGEPVDLFTGLYTMNATDLSLPDGLPAVLTRTYRDQDDVIRGFGWAWRTGSTGSSLPTRSSTAITR
jgi:YD repeat-containing protein